MGIMSQMVSTTHNGVLKNKCVPERGGHSKHILSVTPVSFRQPVEAVHTCQRKPLCKWTGKAFCGGSFDIPCLCKG